MNPVRPIRPTAAFLLVAVGLLSAALLAPATVLAEGGAVASSSVEDGVAGYSLRPMAGWEPAPRKNPGDPTAGNEIGGWYVKRAGRDGARCIVLGFGSPFPEDKREAVATAPAGPATPPPGGGEGGEPDGPGEGAPAKPPEGPKSLEELFGPKAKSFDEWFGGISKRWVAMRLEVRESESETLKLGGDPARLVTWQIRGPTGRGFGEVYRVQAAIVRRDAYEVAAVYMAAPEDWQASAFKTSLKSLALFSKARMEALRRKREKAAEGPGSDQEKWLEDVKSRIPPGWKYRRTKNYLIVYDKSLEAAPPIGYPALPGIIERQLEAIRAQIYEKMFPPEKPFDAISVVKITQDREQYLAYGAPPGSAGYWSWPARELVFFWNARDGEVTLDVLNHEAFHQYIFYSVGMIAPHSWFNEGHGDYFAGFEFKEGKFKEAKFHWRTSIIEEAIGRRKHAPLAGFLKYSQADYYRPDSVSRNYAQGWSFIWFLRTTKKPEYQGILERYFKTLKAEVAAWRDAEAATAAKENRKPLDPALTPEPVHDAARNKALEAAFGGLDLEALERDWIASKPW